MIQVYYRSRQHIPLLMCDVCGRRIDDAKDGVAVFPAQQTDGELAAVKHVHAGACHSAAETSFGGRDKCAWQQLGKHVVYLAHNAGLSIDRLQAIARQEGEFGL